MADRLSLSLWLRGFTEHNMLSFLDRALGRFPVSRQSPGGRVTVYAVEYSEPPVAERIFETEVTVEEVIETCREFANPDCAFELETWWDLWRFEENDWHLLPAKVIITLYAPLFPSDLGEQLRVDFGNEEQFLPPEGQPATTRAVQSNLRSVLTLADDLEQNLPLQKRLLWSESGDSLAERLQAAVSEEADAEPAD